MGHCNQLTSAIHAHNRLNKRTMQTKLKIIETPECTLAVSDEEGKHAEWVYWEKDNERPVKFQRGEYLGAKKIIGYQPKGNAPELDLPLLPEMVVEDGVEGLAYQYYISNEHFKAADAFHWANGYRAATKVFTEQDLRKAIAMAKMAKTHDGLIDMDAWISNGYEGAIPAYTEDEIIQSLKQPNTPKWFVAEMEETPNFERSVGNIQANYIKRLKTTTINGKTYLVGEYLSE
jgi:hypothetical protein